MIEDTQLSPHDETVLFSLVELDRSLPREERSRRFNVKVYREANGSSHAQIKASTSSKELRLRTDVDCFGELSKRGFVHTARVIATYQEEQASVDCLETVQLKEAAFDYYADKHDFPTALADERRELVDSTVSTAYPEVVSYLKKAYDALWHNQLQSDWSSVAHDCQRALRSFADAAYNPEYSGRLGEKPPSSADYREKLEQTIRACSTDEELRGLLVKFDRYADARRHDPGTTADEAKRCVLFAYLLVAEIVELIEVSSSRITDVGGK